MNEMSSAQKDKLMSDLRLVVADAEELVRLTASQTGEGVAEARSRVQSTLGQAKNSLLHAQDVLVTKAKEAGHVADDYVHQNPWRSIGAAAGIGLLVGMLIGRR
ncbi:MAG: DUF883 domain-containing protein [Rhizobacter sp.]|nr:DUF883 domain-containing protein [Rhizobacter sp.]